MLIQCPLCERCFDSLHKKSHILPKWMETHDANRKGLILIDIENQRETTKQSGRWAEIVCESCEAGFGIYDRYACNTLGKANDDGKLRDPKIRLAADYSKETGTLRAITWHGIDYIKLRNFVYSIVLRGHLERLKNSGKRILTEEQFALLRHLYFSEMSIKEAFPIVIVGIYDPDGLETICIPPFLIDPTSARERVVFQGAGLQFYIWTNKGLKPDYVKNVALSDDGRMVTVVMPFRNTGIYRSSVDDLLKTIEFAESTREQKRLKKS